MLDIHHCSMSVSYALRTSPMSYVCISNVVPVFSARGGPDPDAGPQFPVDGDQHSDRLRDLLLLHVADGARLRVSELQTHLPQTLSGQGKAPMVASLPRNRYRTVFGTDVVLLVGKSGGRGGTVRWKGSEASLKYDTRKLTSW